MLESDPSAMRVTMRMGRGYLFCVALSLSLIHPLVLKAINSIYDISNQCYLYPFKVCKSLTHYPHPYFQRF